MKKALSLSLLLHTLVFVLFFFMLPENSGQKQYTVLSVTFLQNKEGRAPVEQAAPEEVVTEAAETKIAETVQGVNVPNSTDTQSVEFDIMESQDSLGIVAAGQDEMITDNSTGLEPVDNKENRENKEEEIVFDAPVAERESRGPLDISWSGEENRRLIKGGAPDLSIPGNRTLLDQVELLFSVYPDGKVYNVRIVPPGSSSFQVDRQLREWARLLVFEKSSSQGSAEGILRIHLSIRELP